MGNAKRDLKLFKFYNEAGDKYPSTELNYKAASALARKRFLCSLLQQNRRALTLDIGCSDGLYKPYIRNHVGLDIALARLKKFTGRRVWAIAEHLPFKKRVFNRIFMSELLEHTWKRKQILNECHRVLKSKGILIISVPFGKRLFHIQTNWDALEKYGVAYCPYVHGHFTKKYTRNLMKQSKFRIILLKMIKSRKGGNKFLIVKARKVI